MDQNRLFLRQPCEENSEYNCLGSFHRYFLQASVSSWGLAAPEMVLISLSDKLSLSFHFAFSKQEVLHADP